MVGNGTFDPNAEGTYEFRMTVKPKDGGPSLSVNAVVSVAS